MDISELAAGSVIRFEEEGHRYFVNEVEFPSVSEILKTNGFLEMAYSTEEDRQRGTAIHLAAQFHDQKRLDWSSVHPFIKGWVNAYVKFRDETRFDPLIIEAPVCSLKYKFCGTPDRIGRFPGDSRLFILDIKSGNPDISARLALAAYEVAVEETIRHEVGPIARIILQLYPDGGYRTHPIYDNPSDKRAFLCATGLYHWKKNQGVIK